MAKLRWSLQAAEDLDEACRYIARDSEQYARLFAQRVMLLLKSMAKEKLPGSMVPEYRAKTFASACFTATASSSAFVPSQTCSKSFASSTVPGCCRLSTNKPGRASRRRQHDAQLFQDFPTGTALDAQV
jgi:hypothetical protein